MDDVHTRLARVTDLQELEMINRKIASPPTWPFDIQVVSKFVTIVLPVTAVLLSRLITGFLHIRSKPDGNPSLRAVRELIGKL